MKAFCTEEEFIALWKKLGSPSLVAAALKIDIRNAMTRRRHIEAKRGIVLDSWNDRSPKGRKALAIKHQGKIETSIDNGTVLVFSDAHYWPGFKTTAHRALVAMAKQLRPTAIVCNGDAFDGATISRFPRPFFDEEKPSVNDELLACQERLGELEAVSTNLIWTLGNHDLRFEARLAGNAPQYEGVSGMHLKDHFPHWKAAWSFWINGDVEIRHRYHGGLHATHNNVMKNHHTTVTGHLHALQVRPYTDGRGVQKYGVDTGTLADPDGPQFCDYLEGRNPNWRSGFVVLTFKDGNLLMPELVMKHDEDHVQFRGHVLHADTMALA